MLILIGLAVLLIQFGYRTSIDQDSKQLAELGVHVSLSENSAGVPTISADSEHDVYFTTGFLHAKERLGQLVMQRALARGNLSEILGRGHLQSDIWMRRLRLVDSASLDAQSMDAEAKRSLQAYADGINAWVELNGVSQELLLVAKEFQPWQIEDSLLTQKLFALNLSVNYVSEMENLILESTRSDERVSSSNHLHNNSVETKLAFSQLLEMQQNFTESTGLGEFGVGSNAWVVSGKHTASGAPLLANDPHLAMTVPSMWFAIEQQHAKSHIKGMSIIGLPIVVFGANEYVAWGGTNMLADTQDLVVEQVHPASPKQYQTADGWAYFDSIEAEIRVNADFPAGLNKPFEPIKLKIRKTHNGPIISDSIAVFDAPVAMRWTSLQGADLSYQSLYKLNYASNWEAFREALSTYKAPALNFLYADKLGNIGYQAAGAIPLRDSPVEGLPLAGWQSGSEWQGYIPFTELPSSYNPPSGYIVSANDEVVSPQGHYLSNEWADPSRAMRIKELLEFYISTGKKMDVNDARIMQLDTVDLNGKQFTEVLRQLGALSKIPQHLAVDFESWDGDMMADSPIPALYISWMRNLKLAIFSDEMLRFSNSSGLLAGYINRQTSANIYQLLIANDPYCNNINTPKTETCLDILMSSFDSASAELSDLTGENSEDWRWVNISNRLIPHLMFNRVPFFEDLYNLKGDKIGSYDTINVAGYRFDKFGGYESAFGASFRQVYELTPKLGWHYTIAGGQTANPMDKHYDDLYQVYLRGELLSH
nr:penicillin acylase family protein [Pseudoalteromonas luteoviolacea]